MKHNSEIINSFYEKNKTTPKSILDLGCGSTLFNFFLINSLNPSKYTAVDIKNIEYKLRYYLENLIEPNYINDRLSLSKILESLENDYYKYFQYYISEVLKLEIHYTKEEFINTFEFIKSDIFDYIEKLEQKYDLIIISKLLSHLLPLTTKNDKALINSCRGKLTSNGIIYLRLNGEGYQTKDASIPNEYEISYIRKTYNKNSIEKLIRGMVNLSGLECIKVEKSNTTNGENYVNEYSMFLKNAT